MGAFFHHLARLAISGIGELIAPMSLAPLGSSALSWQGMGREKKDAGARVTEPICKWDARMRKEATLTRNCAGTDRSHVYTSFIIEQQG